MLHSQNSEMQKLLWKIESSPIDFLPLTLWQLEVEWDIYPFVWHCLEKASTVPIGSYWREQFVETVVLVYVVMVVPKNVHVPGTIKCTIWLKNVCSVIFISDYHWQEWRNMRLLCDHCYFCLTLSHSHCWNLVRDGWSFQPSMVYLCATPSQGVSLAATVQAEASITSAVEESYDRQ